MIKKISGHGLTAERIFRADSMQLQLSEKDSTASFTCGADAGGLKTGDWLQDKEEPGKDVVWRIKSIDDQRDTGTRTIQLEHIINTLKDRIIPGEIKTEDISGSSASAGARAAINKILSYQSDWVLGDFDYDAVSNPYHFDGETLKAAIEAVSSSLEDPVWEYDFSRYPFRLHIRRLSGRADSEMRGGRNLRTIRITEDRSQMYTRFYPRGKNNLKISGSGYVEKNTAQYGIIEKTETDSTKESEAELLSWANERLNRHARPGHTVTISGLELSAETGESLDRLTIGHKCRVPLPEDGETVTEKITKLQWKDKIKDPQDVTVTLADALEDVASIMKQEQQKSSGGGRAAAKADEENTILIGSVEQGLYTAIVQTSTNIIQHVHDTLRGYSTIEMTATAIRESVSTAKSDMWAQIQITATGILQTVGTTLQGYSTIQQTADAIALSVNSAKTGMWAQIQVTATGILQTVNNTLSGYSTIQQTADAIALSVNSAKTGIYSEIKLQKDRIDLVVSGSGSSASIKKAALILAINGQGGSSAKLSADVIDIDGLVTKLEAKTLGVGGLHVEGQSEFLRSASFEAGLSADEKISAYGGILVGEHDAEWKSFSYDTLTYGTYHYYLYATNQQTTVASGSVGAYPVTGHTSHTIYYLGRSA